MVDKCDTFHGVGPSDRCVSRVGGEINLPMFLVLLVPVAFVVLVVLCGY